MKTTFEPLVSFFANAFEILPSDIPASDFLTRRSRNQEILVNRVA
jgi:hypothetical protein